MSEIWIRELLLFGGAVVGAVWGYLFGGFAARRRLARAMSPDLETLERWSTQVCQRLDRLELSREVTSTVEGVKSS